MGWDTSFIAGMSPPKSPLKSLPPRGSESAQSWRLRRFREVEGPAQGTFERTQIQVTVHDGREPQLQGLE